MSFHGYDPGDRNNWYQSPQLGLFPAGYSGGISGNYYCAGSCYLQGNSYSQAQMVTNFTKPNPYPPPPHNPSATIINGHLLPHQFPCVPQTHSQFFPPPYLQPIHPIAPQPLTTTPQSPSIPTYHSPHPTPNIGIHSSIPNFQSPAAPTFMPQPQFTNPKPPSCFRSVGDCEPLALFTGRIQPIPSSSSLSSEPHTYLAEATNPSSLPPIFGVPEQMEVIHSKLAVSTLMEELQKPRQSLSVAEEVNLAVQVDLASPSRNRDAKVKRDDAVVSKCVDLAVLEALEKGTTREVLDPQTVKKLVLALEPAQVLLDVLVDDNVLELLVQNLLRLSNSNPDEMAAVYSTLATIENLFNCLCGLLMPLENRDISAGIKEEASRRAVGDNSLRELAHVFDIKGKVELTNKLCEKLFKEKDQHQDIASIAVKAMVAEVSIQSLAQLILVSILPQLIKGITALGMNTEIKCALLSQSSPNQTSVRKKTVSCISSLVSSLSDDLLAKDTIGVVQHLSNKGSKSEMAQTSLSQVATTLNLNFQDVRRSFESFLSNVIKLYNRRSLNYKVGAEIWPPDDGILCFLIKLFAMIYSAFNDNAGNLLADDTFGIMVRNTKLFYKFMNVLAKMLLKALDKEHVSSNVVIMDTIVAALCGKCIDSVEQHVMMDDVGHSEEFNCIGSKLGELADVAQKYRVVLAEKVFANVPEVGVFSWNVKFGEKKSGRQMFDNFLCLNVISWNAILSGYFQNEDYMEVKYIFHNMQELDGCWRAMIAGLSFNSQDKEAFAYSKKMRQHEMLPTEFSYAAILSCCAELASSFREKEITASLTLMKILLAKVFEIVTNDGFADNLEKMCLLIAGRFEIIEGNAKMMFDDICGRWNSIVMVANEYCTEELHVHFLEEHMKLDEKCLGYVLSTLDAPYTMQMGFNFNYQNLLQLLSSYVSGFAMEEAFTSLGLLQIEYQIDQVDVKAIVSRFSYEGLSKLVASFLDQALTMILYSLRLIRVGHKSMDYLPFEDFDYPTTPRYIYVFLGFGVTLCVITCSGPIVADTANGCGFQMTSCSGAQIVFQNVKLEDKFV